MPMSASSMFYLNLHSCTSKHTIWHWYCCRRFWRDTTQSCSSRKTSFSYISLHFERYAFFRLDFFFRKSIGCMRVCASVYFWWWKKQKVTTPASFQKVPPPLPVAIYIIVSQQLDIIYHVLHKGAGSCCFASSFVQGSPILRNIGSYQDIFWIRD